MKKIITRFTPLLTVALLAACTASPVNKVKNVELASVSQLNQAEGTHTVSVNLNLRDKGAAFDIKDIGNGFNSVAANVDLVEVRLNNIDPTASSASVIWKNGPTRLFSQEIANPGANSTFTFAGLRNGQTYAVTARAYRIFRPGYTADGSLGASQVTLSNALNEVTVGDELYLDPDGINELVYAIGVNGNTIDVVPALANNYTGATIEIKSNITSKGDIGDLDGSPSGQGMGDGTQEGNGTAPGLETSPGMIEYVTVDSDGILTIVNDNGNNTWDIAVQLMKDADASVDGNVSVLDGSELLPGSETLINVTP